MIQYAVYENRGAGRKVYSYLLNVHHVFADVFNYCIMIPLIPLNILSSPPPKRICPVINVERQQYVVMTHMMAGVVQKEVGDVIIELEDEIYAVKDGIDFLFNGI